MSQVVLKDQNELIANSIIKASGVRIIMKSLSVNMNAFCCRLCRIAKIVIHYDLKIIEIIHIK